MQIVRTIVWVLVLAALLAFSMVNWEPVEVTIWTDLIVETKIPALVIVAFLLGLLPMWLVHRGVRWRLERRIAALESSLHSGAVSAGTLAAEEADHAQSVEARRHEERPYRADPADSRDRYSPEAPNARTAPSAGAAADERKDRE